MTPAQLWLPWGFRCGFFCNGTALRRRSDCKRSQLNWATWCGVLLGSMAQADASWDVLGHVVGVTWPPGHLVSLGVTWCHLVSPGHLVSPAWSPCATLRLQVGCLTWSPGPPSAPSRRQADARPTPGRRQADARPTHAHVYVGMQVFMYVCVYVCMYAGMYACMYA